MKKLFPLILFSLSIFSSFACLPLKRKEKLTPIKWVRIGGEYLLEIKQHEKPNAADTINMVIQKFLPCPTERGTVVPYVVCVPNPVNTQIQYYQLGRIIGIRRKDELEITWFK